MSFHFHVFTSLVSFGSAWRSPFSISCRAGLVMTDPSAFVCLRKCFVSISEAQLYQRKYSWLTGVFLILVLWIYHLLLSWPVKICGEKSVHSLVEVPSFVKSLFSSCFQISLSLMFDSVVTVCLSEDLFGLNLCEGLWCPWMSTSLPRFGNFQPVYL